MTNRKESYIIHKYGELSERLKVQSWKGCVAKVTKSSNLLLSAIFEFADVRASLALFFIIFRSYENSHRNGWLLLLQDLIAHRLFDRQSQIVKLFLLSFL